MIDDMQCFWGGCRKLRKLRLTSTPGRFSETAGHAPPLVIRCSRLIRFIIGCSFVHAHALYSLDPATIMRALFKISYLELFVGGGARFYGGSALFH